MERIRKYEPLWGKWKATRLIGEGSFGTVYEVESEFLGNASSCAVKLISFKNTEMFQGVDSSGTQSAEDMEKLQIEEAKKNVREAVLMEKLQGRDHIVTIYDYDIFPQERTTDVAIRMELLTNLTNYIAVQDLDSEEKVIDIVIKLGIDICKALEDCEEVDIVHRDIKPDNIFINENKTFKLGDFGLSRKMNKSASFSLRKSAGTPLYMAPEAFGWGRKADHLSDIYSLGIVMYQLLNEGNIPFASNMKDFGQVDESIERRADGEELLSPKYGAGRLWEILKKACQFKKEDRYQSAKEFRKELEKLKNEIKIKEKKDNEEKATTPDKDKILEELSKMREELEQLKAEKNRKIKNGSEVENIEKKHYSEGDTVWFGTYPQGISSDSIEEIEWTVLKIEEGKMLLLSNNVLDVQPYHKERKAITWEKSSIRKWLNEEFYNEVFNDSEKSRIKNTFIEGEKNEEFGTLGGNNTLDKVFLLSIKDVKDKVTLLNDEKKLRGKATEFAALKRVYLNEESENAMWWLRTLGYNGYYAAVVNEDGNIVSFGKDVIDSKVGVRPAVWVDMES